MAPLLPSSTLAKRIIETIQERAPEALEATRSVPLGVSHVVARQATVTVTAVPAGGSDSSDSGSRLSGGAIAGIVIGSIAGFLLLWWIVRSCTNLGAPRQQETYREPAWYNDDVVDPRRSRSRRRSHSHSYSHSHHAHTPRQSREIRQVTPVVVDDRVRRPSKTYVYESGGGRRSSRRSSRDYY